MKLSRKSGLRNSYFPKRKMAAVATPAAGLKPPKPLVLGENMADQWRKWIRQFVWFGTATQLTDKPPMVQVATFMSALGEDCFRIYDTFGLTEEEENYLIVIKAKFDDFFIPKTCVTYERYNLNKIVQGDDEAVDNFITRVKEQAKKCAFGDLHDSLVKDRIIFGLKFIKLVPQLLNDALQKTIELCRNHELTMKQSKFMIGEEKVEVIKTRKKREVNKKQERQSTENVDECKKCGWKHKPQFCPAADKDATDARRKDILLHSARTHENRVVLGSPKCISYKKQTVTKEVTRTKNCLSVPLKQLTTEKIGMKQ